MEKEKNASAAATEKSNRCKTGAFFEAVAKRAAENVTKNAIESAGFEALSDKDLYALCKEYGGRARQWARKFAFLLPEVARRGLHRKYKCESIYEFSAKLAGMNHEVTYRILSLAGRLKEMPKLWRLFRKHGWSKLRVVAEAATPETENYWVEKVENMSKGTLTLFIKELKNQERVEMSNLFNSDFGPKEGDGNSSIPLNKPQTGGALNFGAENPEGNSVTGIANDGCDSLTNVSKLRTFRKLKFQVNGATEIDLRVFKAELEKVRKEAVTMGEALRALLEIAGLAKMLSRCMPREYRSMFPYWRT